MMLRPDAAADVAACLARLGVLEDERRAALLQDSRTEADQATISSIVGRQEVDALAFARRAAP